jgi:ribosomal protein S18 acetylase RimI-like enzyme
MPSDVRTEIKGMLRMRSPKLPSKLKIRDMTIYDIADAFTIGDSVFTKDEHVFLYRTWDTYEVTELFSSSPELCIVAEMGGKVIGFTLGFMISKHGSPWTYGYLVWTGVRREFQRYKVGKRLYMEFERRAIRLGARMMIIDTEGTNLQALKFFKAMGFSRGSEHVWMTKVFSRARTHTKKPDGSKNMKRLKMQRAT